ncbi:MAG: NAD(P)/FAD-dependent oxidoreductase [Moorea sp. SIOASIH]|uniref:flavin-containing monooxygenase n=1 Tax=Moorena sp. SIOASIH TaxID=2607817 RepID=UPI0013B9AC48|nr:NAD(P)/FAD-dependent oxidoreductase [Moorena sp. SIOASIH]NEO37549.1 NAD(P)/FAD-dependent oxidoreductase [Moorena sp. SIOASIH]
MQVVIIGAGMSGICMAIKLKKAKINFVILEKSSQIGGTWRDNNYPGCACDIPAHLYCYSFEMKHDWNQVYPSQPEIFKYLEHCTSKYNIYPHIRFNQEVISANFNGQNCLWYVNTAEKETITANILISAWGGLNLPKLPNLNSLETFKGVSFHSARWNHSFDLTDKTVAVVGTAASAVQFIPEVAKKVKQLFIFQRTPNWITNRDDRTYSAQMQWYFKNLPILMQLHRGLLYLRNDLISFSLFTTGSFISKYLRKQLEKRIHQEIADYQVRDAVMPSYQPGCKRILINNDFYQSLNRKNVALITDNIESITTDSLVTEPGKDYKVDAIIYATGFNSLSYKKIDIRGKNGESIAEIWGNEPEAYLGISVPNFPNFFSLLGPNTGLGHSSVILMVECQVNYIIGCLNKMLREDWKSLEVKEEAMRRYYQDLWKTMEKRVWTKENCMSWYQNKDGRVFALWPGNTIQYWWATRKPIFDDYIST